MGGFLPIVSPPYGKYSTFAYYLVIFCFVFFFFPELQEPVTDKLEEAAVLSSVALPSNPVEIEIETPEQRKKRERG